MVTGKAGPRSVEAPLLPATLDLAKVNNAEPWNISEK